MSQSVINLLNEKMQDAFLGDFAAYLKEDGAGKFTGDSDSTAYFSQFWRERASKAKGRVATNNPTMLSIIPRAGREEASSG